MNAVAEDGRPHRITLPEGGGYSLATLSQGVIDLIVAEQCVIGVVQKGESVWGRLALDRVVLWELDLRDVDDVTMDVQ